jgi:hypothetical protein
MVASRSIGKVISLEEKPRYGNEELAAAEDLRRQLQEGFGIEVPIRPQSNPLIHSELAAKTLGDANYEGIVESINREVAATELISPYDEPLTRTIMKKLCEELETACHELSIPLRSGVAYGSTGSMEVEAARYSVFFTEASVITFSVGFLNFCSHASKLVAISLPHEPVGELFRIYLDINRVFSHINANKDLKRQWTELIGAYAFGSGPTIVPSLGISGAPAVTRMQLLSAMERFAIAHEYAHHVADDGKREIVSSDEDELGKSEEYRADFFALRICRYLESKETIRNFHLDSGTGAVLLLKCLECVRRARHILVHGDDTMTSHNHPETSARILAFDSIDEFLSEPNRALFKQARDCVSAVIDRLWKGLKPLYVQMHEFGLRPIEK